MEIQFAPLEVNILLGCCKSDPVVKGGSDRVFTRVTDSRGATAIHMRYTNERVENDLFVPIARMLAAEKMPVPEIYHFDAEAREVWLQDLGECDLHGLEKAEWSLRREAYVDALVQVARLHALDAQSCLGRHPGVKLMPGFDEKLYRWEREYFLENAVGRIFGIQLEEAEMAGLLAEFDELSERLLPESCALIHRDFQSQNVMWHEKRAWFIDFQGLRLGHPLYDVGSLLYDPYVNFSSVQRLELSDVYFEAVGVDKADRDMQREVLYLCSAQRLMQALGAYGFLSLVRGKTHYLDYVGPALANLREVLGACKSLPSLRSLIDRLLSVAVK